MSWSALANQGLGDQSWCPCYPNLSSVMRSSKGRNGIQPQEPPHSDFTISLLLYFLEVCCPVPNLNNDGSITLRRRLSNSTHCIYFSGDEISYECHNKYRLDATCTKYGTWRPRTPECSPGKTLWKHIFLKEVFHVKLMEIIIFAFYLPTFQ